MGQIEAAGHLSAEPVIGHEPRTGTKARELELRAFYVAKELLPPGQRVRVLRQQGLGKWIEHVDRVEV